MRPEKTRINTALRLNFRDEPSMNFSFFLRKKGGKGRFFGLPGGAKTKTAVFVLRHAEFGDRPEDVGMEIL